MFLAQSQRFFEIIQIIGSDIPAKPTFPKPEGLSIMRAQRFHFSVRNGKRWVTLRWITGKSLTTIILMESVNAFRSLRGEVALPHGRTTSVA